MGLLGVPFRGLTHGDVVEDGEPHPNSPIGRASTFGSKVGLDDLGSMIHMSF